MAFPPIIFNNAAFAITPKKAYDIIPSALQLQFVLVFFSILLSMITNPSALPTGTPKNSGINAF